MKGKNGEKPNNPLFLCLPFFSSSSPLLFSFRPASLLLQSLPALPLPSLLYLLPCPSLISSSPQFSSSDKPFPFLLHWFSAAILGPSMYRAAALGFANAARCHRRASSENTSARKCPRECYGSEFQSDTSASSTGDKKSRALTKFYAGKQIRIETVNIIIFFVLSSLFLEFRFLLLPSWFFLLLHDVLLFVLLASSFLILASFFLFVSLCFFSSWLLLLASTSSSPFFFLLASFLLYRLLRIICASSSTTR